MSSAQADGLQVMTRTLLRFHVLYEQHMCHLSMFEPRVCRNGGFTAVAVVVEQLLALVNVSGSNEDEVRDVVDVVKFGLAISIFTVIYQPAHSIGLLGGVHAVSSRSKQHSCQFHSRVTQLRFTTRLKLQSNKPKFGVSSENCSKV